MTLRWYQSEAVNACWDHLCTRQDNPCIVLPTGSGKSHVLAQLTQDAIQRHRGRVLILAHRKELLRQNGVKLPGGVGYYSAGLSSRDTEHDCILAGIQSVFRRASEFGRRHLLLIDEAHLISDRGASMYQQFIADLREINPSLRIVGLTATPFRTDIGPLCRPGGLLQKVCYSADVQRLIADGFLCPLISKAADATEDTSGIRKRGGEFANFEVAQQFDQSAKVEKACSEILAKTANRKSVLVFCSSVEHAEHVAARLNAAVVTGETLPIERERTLQRFSNGEIKYLCNVDVLTTGFDSPRIDCVVILRATMSPGLVCQMVGRGFRIHESKSDCLVLDFGENIKRHGPVDAVDFGKPKGVAEGIVAGEAPTKICPNCKTENTLNAKSCLCGWQFPPPQLRHDETADEASQILATPKRWIVEEVDFSRHEKRDSDSVMLRVDYACIPEESKGGNLERHRISEWVCLEHEGFAARKAAGWWNQHSNATGDYSTVPTVDEAVELFQRGAVATPHHITTVRDGRWYRIVERELDDRPEVWSDVVEEFDFEDEEIPF